jgi:hypothetical protein
MVKTNGQIRRSGNGSFELYGKYQTELVCKQMIPVDFAKTYKLSVWMRTFDQALPASGYCGLYMYDKNHRRININNVFAFPGTETELIATAAVDSKELLVPQNMEWFKFKDSAIAFNIKDDYSDLPNFELIRVDKIIEEDKHFRVILQSALKKSYPAKTKIRLHSPWNAPFYWVASGWMPVE